MSMPPPLTREIRTKTGKDQISKTSKLKLKVPNQMTDIKANPEAIPEAKAIVEAVAVVNKEISLKTEAAHNQDQEITVPDQALNPDQNLATDAERTTIINKTAGSKIKPA